MMPIEKAVSILSNTFGPAVTEEEQEAALRMALVPQPREEWREDDGIVLWWEAPTGAELEPPYVGTPLDDGFPEWVTHWTPIIVPDFGKE